MIKVCLAGNTMVGKTSIMKKFIDRSFNPELIQPTVGVESNPRVEMKTSDGKLVVLTIWDTAGQEVYRNLVPMFFRGANVTILVAANDDINSIKGTAEWQEMVLQTAPNCKFLLVVNKADLPAGEGIDDSYISDMGRSIGALETFKTSAITGQNIDELFQYIVDSNEIEADEQYLNGLDTNDKVILNITEENKPKGKGCC